MLWFHCPFHPVLIPRIRVAFNTQWHRNERHCIAHTYNFQHFEMHSDGGMRLAKNVKYVRHGRKENI